MNLFAYGTLMETDIMAQVSGGTFRVQEGTLHGYARKQVLGEVYPGIIKQRGSFVDGIVYFNVPQEAFDRLDSFEGSLYLRTEAVVLCDKGQRVNTQTYVIKATSAHQLSDDDWSLENFRRHHKQLFKVRFIR